MEGQRAPLCLVYSYLLSAESPLAGTAVEEIVHVRKSVEMERVLVGGSSVFSG